MKRSLVWLLAFIITAASAVYQRMTGPTYHFRGKVEVVGTEVAFKLPRSAEVISDCEVAVKIADRAITGRLTYRRFKTSDPWTDVPLVRKEDKLVGYLPKQPMAGKLVYRVFLTDQGKDVSLSDEEAVIVRFKGVVPLPILILHVLVMFAAMLFSTRAGIAALQRGADPRKLAVCTAVLLFVGGFIFGPLVQKLAFGSWWTGVPFGWDLTDNKTLIALVIWAVALIAGRKGRPARGWILAAAMLMLIVFMIPHSVFGSELDYTKLGQ
jgi:hypothetical protein